MSIINFIEKYRKNKRILFTTPSHNQGSFISPVNKKMLGEKFFSCDYSELDGFDNLSNPTGIIKNAQKDVAEICNSKAAFFLTNGSTSGIIAAMYSILNKNDKVLIARNCHKSVYNGLVLSGAVPIWFMPHYDYNWGIYNSLNLASLENILSKNKDIKAVIITNPTYEGAKFDIYEISNLCKKYGKYLIVDEAHGALWNFDKTPGISAINQGADIVIQSLHKTIGALNPCALLHIGKTSKITQYDIQRTLNLITTTSPSYPLLLNIEAAVKFPASSKGQKYIQNYICNIKNFVQSVRTIPNVEIYSTNNDITKIFVKVKNMSGFSVSDIMTNEYGIEDELANEKAVLYLTGIGTTKSKLKKLEKSLKNLASKNIVQGDDTYNNKIAICEPKMKYTPNEVWNKPFEEIDLKQALSRVSMELITDYPPGVPILLPGEIIQKEHIDYLIEKRNTINVTTV